MWTHEGIGLATSLATGLARLVAEQSMQYLWQSQQSLASWTSRLLPQSLPGQLMTTKAVILPSAEHAEQILVAMQHEWTGAGAASGAAMQVQPTFRLPHLCRQCGQTRCLCLRLAVAPQKTSPQGQNTQAQGMSQQHQAEASHHRSDTRDDRSTERCSICLEDVLWHEMHPIGSCWHSFCMSCLDSHIQTKLKGKCYQIPCPQPSCVNGIPYRECSSVLSRRQDKQLLDQRH